MSSEAALVWKRFVVSLLMLALFAAVTGFVLHRILSRRSRGEVEGRLLQSVILVKSAIDLEKTRISKSIELAGRFPVMRAAIEAANHQAIRSAASDYPKDLNLPILEIVDSKGTVVSMSGRAETLYPIAEQLVSIARSAGSVATIGDWDGRIAILAATRVGSGDSRGVILAGSIMENSFAKKIHELIQVDVSFVLNDAISGSSLDQRFFSEVRSQFKVLNSNGEKAFESANFFTLASGLDIHHGKNVGRTLLHIRSEGTLKADFDFVLLNVGTGCLMFVVSLIVIHFLSQPTQRPEPMADRFDQAG